jgi:hypothetical protein
MARFANEIHLMVTLWMFAQTILLSTFSLHQWQNYGMLGITWQLTNVIPDPLKQSSEMGSWPLPGFYLYALQCIPLYASE